MFPTHFRQLAYALSCCAIINLCGCGLISAHNTLYLDLGSKEGIARITENFIMEIARDDRVIDHFQDSNVQRFREKFAEHLCFIADGPCEYSGDNMVDIHTGMGVTEGEFNAVVEDLTTAMDKAQIALGTQNRVLARLGLLREDIIYQ